MSLVYSKQAIKFLASQGHIAAQRIRNAIEKLPLGDVVKLKGEDAKYRLRVGDYRVIFTRSGVILFIEAINNRGQIYKN